MRSRESGTDWVAARVGPPIITPDSHPTLGTNINGPSVIRVPPWVEEPLGKYYLYFASHIGDSIRLAFSDDIESGWNIHPHGVLHLERTGFIDHIASPDVHVDEERQLIRMYFHGLHRRVGWDQRTRLALSSDGLEFAVDDALLGGPYFRVFEWDDMWYALAMPGIFYRSRNGLSSFEEGPRLFTESMRHSAVVQDARELTVFYSNAGDCPEAILASRIDLTGDWREWKTSTSQVVLAPELPYEGGELELRPSERGAAHEPVRQLRDPFVFREADANWLFYAVAGERGIAVARLLRRVTD